MNPYGAITQIPPLLTFVGLIATASLQIFMYRYFEANPQHWVSVIVMDLPA